METDKTKNTEKPHAVGVQVEPIVSRLKVGSNVSVEHGLGEIVGKDLPDSKDIWRWVIKINKPKPEYMDMVNRFKGAKLCYMDNEVYAC